MIKWYQPYVEAVAYDETNFKEIKKWLKEFKVDVGEHQVWPDYKKFLSIEWSMIDYMGFDWRPHRYAKKGDYIVRWETGKIEVFAPRLFREIFEGWDGV